MDNEMYGDSANEIRARIQELFPQTVSDGQIDMHALGAMIGEAPAESGLPSFGLQWRGKDSARRLAEEPSAATLRPRREVSLKWDHTTNLLIEGDNLDALKCLSRAHTGQVKMIYIDPPYNTGNRFIYRDNFHHNLSDYLKAAGSKSEEHRYRNLEKGGRLHTQWLNMIYPRLILARQLLSEDGVIFISIDDHEVHNLRHLLDEIFGPDNFVTNLIWQSRTSISNDHVVSSNHNHTLVYAKNHDALVFHGDPLDASKYCNPDNDPRGPWKLVPLDANKPGGNTRYPIVNPETGQSWLPPNNRIWAINPKSYQRLFDDGRILFGKRGKSAPKRKMFLNERVARGDSKTPSSLLMNAGSTKVGTEEVMGLFDGLKVFDYPKPLALMKRLLRYGCRRDGANLVLDFFSGSASFAHACLETDDLDIRFIAVQLPEVINQEKAQGRNALALGLTTISQLGQERLRRAIARIEDVNPERGPLGFRCYSLAESVLQGKDDRPMATARGDDFEPPDRTDLGDDDLVHEILLEYGQDLASPIESVQVLGLRVHSIESGRIILCLAKRIEKGQCQAMASWIGEHGRQADWCEHGPVIFRRGAFDDSAVIEMQACLAAEDLGEARFI